MCQNVPESELQHPLSRLQAGDCPNPVANAVHADAFKYHSAIPLSAEQMSLDPFRTALLQARSQATPSNLPVRKVQHT